MHITSFWAKNYRSLRDVRLDGLGPFNVFYGPNGAGKSNILSGLQTLFGFAAARTSPDFTVSIDQPVSNEYLRTFLPDQERWQFQDFEPVVLGAIVHLEPGEQGVDGQVAQAQDVILELVSDAPGVGLRFSRLQHGPTEAAAVDLLAVVTASKSESNRSKLAWVRDLAERAYALVGADRAPRPETLDENFVDVGELLADRQLKQALFRAKNHRSRAIRRRYQQLQELLAGEPLKRPPFDPVYDPRDGYVDIVEYLNDSGDDPKEVPLDLAGLGIAQIYSILAQILFSNAAAVGIEEPEAHLHAPSTGMHLRQLLQRMVEEGYVQQLFIATHSNLFDLDPNGYWDVAHKEERGTVVSREQLANIDLLHLYEPGPAKHALADYLRVLSPDDIVFRRADGSPISIREMLVMLQRDDPLAKAFLEDVHGAAVRAVRVKRKREGDK